MLTKAPHVWNRKASDYLQKPKAITSFNGRQGSSAKSDLGHGGLSRINGTSRTGMSYGKYLEKTTVSVT